MLLLCNNCLLCVVRMPYFNRPAALGLRLTDVTVYLSYISLVVYLNTCFVTCCIHKLAGV